MFLAETIAKAVQKLLSDNMVAALTTVATRWPADPVTLGSVQHWLFGHHPTVLEHPKADFPIVAVMAVDSTRESSPDQWGLPEYLYEVDVDVFVAEDTEEKTAKKLLRYCEAIIDILEAHQEIGTGILQRDYLPVTISEVNRQFEHGQSKEFLTEFARLRVLVKC